MNDLHYIVITRKKRKEKERKRGIREKKIKYEFEDANYSNYTYVR